MHFIHKLSLFIIFSSKGEKVVLFYYIFNENIAAIEVFKRKREKKKNNVLGIPETFLTTCCEKGRQDKEYLNQSSEVEKCLMPI